MMEQQLLDAPAGDWEQWNEKWPAIGAGPDGCLFTRDAPHTLGAENHQKYWELLHGWLRSVDGWEYWRFCELGAGRGTTSMYLADAGATDITLVDLAPSGFALAEKNFRQHRLPQPKTLVANACATGLPAGSFDCIYNIGLWEHFFDNPRTIIAETLRLLAPDGLFWSIVVQTGGGFRRTEMTPEEWCDLIDEFDGQQAHCEELDVPGVLLCAGWKR